jgi:MGT family glycosyltransferase
MLKGFFLGLPSVSVHKTLLPCIEALSAGGYEMVYYNTEDFEPSQPGNLRFKVYPDHEGGYRPDRIRPDTSYFEFGGMLAETADQVLSFLLAEVEREKPDFILHSHLALWGKLLAQSAGLPAVALFSTFVLDERIMLPFFRKNGLTPAAGFGSTPGAMEFYRKLKALHNRLSLPGKPDIWDVYVNREALNVAFILKCFQPSPELFTANYHFVGSPVSTAQPPEGKDTIYMSMGTILNKNPGLYHLATEALSGFACRRVISVGPRVDIRELAAQAGPISIVPFARQVDELRRSRLFITHGGMASIQEAVYLGTPMIVIPQIPEQQVTADIIESLGIGIHLRAAEISKETLTGAVDRILNDRKKYERNLKALRTCMPSLPAPCYAFNLIDNFLRQTDRNCKTRS